MKSLLHDKPILILCGLSLLALVILANLGSNGWHHVQEYRHLQARMDTLRGSDTLLMHQTLRLKQLGVAARKIGSRQAHVDSHLAFGTYLDSVCRDHAITIVSLPQEQAEQVGTYAVSSERFRLSGGFHDVLKVLYKLEHQDQIGSLAYASLQTQTLRQGRRKQTILLAEIELKRLERKM
ncbi:MAG: hypothetical protein AAF587_31780 [Bacteroidota bacterium]